MQQQIIWEELSKGKTLDELLDIFNNRNSFQVEFAALLNGLFDKDRTCLTAIEVGSSFGVTSAHLDKRFNISLLDLDLNALNLAEKLFGFLGKEVNTYHLDMFKLGNITGEFDLLFNSGVLEHFNFDERVKILTEMKKKLNPGGRIVIAIPNHYSLPYRLGYLYLNLVNRWPYPEEYKIYDFSSEVKQIDGLRQTVRLHINKASIYDFLPLPLKLILQAVGKLVVFEGYLSVVVLENV
ncbi:class I SAM-dependent methyltransferase [Phosphitispora fastidiosa]|uniref:class I SAM-dependent methyltransferase n=1 Tax=Phosphitispora fastidiosa TaxID=2837202 RepID=UPI001E2F9B64|nr:class I SAM-dependent methyltransferase [Phosphitispora fastidiosa]MBU7008190.1 SAM-dependent methyltransferase [Phosphitispora fastidiosa]